MKMLLLLTVILAVTTVAAQADTYVKQASHTDGYYYGGIVTPDEDSEADVWIRDGKMAYITANRIIIVDAEKDVLIFANKDDSSYVETTLPFEWANVADENTVGYLARYMTEGTVEKTGDTKTIDGRKCECYKLHSWIIIDSGEKYQERESTVWATTELPVDWIMYDKINRNIMKLSNFNEEYLAAMTAIKGFMVEDATDTYVKGFSIKSTEKAVEITEKKPGTDVYSLPSYFRKKDQLSMRDLRG